MIDLTLIPPGVAVFLSMGDMPNHLFQIIVDHVVVCEVTSEPPDTRAFAAAVNREIRARFDPAYDACEVP